ncbi:MAG: hypothetical protein AAF542_19870 [Pseudomonadota bacterium]
MNAHIANLLNAIVLLAMSAWAYFSSDAPSVTALIPAGFGLVLLLCSPGVKRENKIVAHVAVLLTLLLLFALFMPLKGALVRDDTIAVLRVGIMMTTTALSLVFFIKSFIDVRRARANS